MSIVSEFSRSTNSPFFKRWYLFFSLYFLIISAISFLSISILDKSILSKLFSILTPIEFIFGLIICLFLKSSVAKTSNFETYSSIPFCKKLNISSSFTSTSLLFLWSYINPDLLNISNAFDSSTAFLGIFLSICSNGLNSKSSYINFKSAVI